MSSRSRTSLLILTLLALSAGDALPEEVAGPDLSDCVFAPPSKALPPGHRSPVTEENDLHWEFDANVPEDCRQYITEYWQDARGPMRTTLGPPSADLTVHVSINPNLPVAGRYWATQPPLMEIRDLPQPDETGDDFRFNWTFTHETVHAFQHAALSGTVSWASEGIAVCATQLISHQLPANRRIWGIWDLDVQTISYDMLGQMGKNALSGCSYFGNVLNRNLCYVSAGGFWWILSSAESEGTVGHWNEYTFLKDFLQRIYAEGRVLGQVDCMTTIQETALRPVDGMAAADWAQSQPITNVHGEPGTFLWATMNPGLWFGNPFATAQLMFQPFSRNVAGGGAYPIDQGRIVIRVFQLDDLNREQEVWSVESTEPGYWGFRVLDLPDQIRQRAGAYRVELDGSPMGADTVELIVLNPPSNWAGYGVDDGMIMGFYDPASGRLLGPSISLQDAKPLASWSGAHAVMPAKTTSFPSSFSVGIQSPAVSAGPAIPMSTWTVPLPYRRVLRVNKPAPVLEMMSWRADDDALGESQGDGDGSPESGEILEIRARIRNTGDMALGYGTIDFAWTPPAPPGLAILRGQASIPGLAPEGECEAIFLVRVETAELASGAFELRWRQAAKVIGTGILTANGMAERVSVGSGGTQGNNFSSGHALSADGRFVAFGSFASNLVEGDTNGSTDVFVYDRHTATTTRVSVRTGGGQADSASYRPSISADGRYVAFGSWASLVDADTNGRMDVYVHDRVTGVTERVSVATDGSESGDDSMGASISADGRFVAFLSWATNFAEGTPPGVENVYVRDRETGTTEIVSVSSEGTPSNGGCTAVSISADGRSVAFESWGWNLVPGDSNGTTDVFVHDRLTGATVRANVSSGGSEAQMFSMLGSISGNGRFVSFVSWDSNLVPGDTNDTGDSFVRDLEAGTTERVSLASDGTEANGFCWTAGAISSDGRFVGFLSYATNLVPGDANNAMDVFVRDRLAGTTRRATVTESGGECNASTWEAAMSADGRFVSFGTEASNVVSGDTNGVSDIFVNR